MVVRLILASIYDLLIVLALLFFITAVSLIFNPQSFIPAGTRWYQFLLVAGIFFYYLLCFKFGGQTIGLKTWQLKLVTNREQLTLLQAFLWLCFALPAISYGFLRFKNPQYFLFKWTKIRLCKVSAL
ncbi:RDD family [Legionella busanensis]|uniref:RDD family n=1 Tax=Legionella busanensis TaxID=190655 RepID=A0A378JPT4_9GAMM|nr:RDD family protein [Legionella busanensis]STX52721.1 RDD family [Legionella busanensis]